MSAYESLAFSYDSLTRDIPYEEITHRHVVGVDVVVSRMGLN